MCSSDLSIDYRGCKHTPQALSGLLPIIYDSVITIIENTLAYLADKHARKEPMPYRVSFVPEGMRKFKFINYLFWSPLGKGGFFHQ